MQHLKLNEKSDLADFAAQIEMDRAALRDGESLFLIVESQGVFPVGLLVADLMERLPELASLPYRGVSASRFPTWDMNEIGEMEQRTDPNRGAYFEVPKDGPAIVVCLNFHELSMRDQRSLTQLVDGEGMLWDNKTVRLHSKSILFGVIPPDSHNKIKAGTWEKAGHVSIEE